MTRLLLLAAAALIALPACTPNRRGTLGPRTVSGISPRGYDDPFSNWRVSQTGQSTRLGYGGAPANAPTAQ